MRHSRVTIAAVVVLFAGGLSACAAEPPADADPTATVAPTPTTEPVELTSPERLLDGDCEALFTSADVAGLVGTALQPSSSEWSLDPDYLVIGQLGGIDCTWTELPVPGGVALSLIALPTSQVTRSPTTECTPGYGCIFGSVEGDFSLYGVLYDPTAPIATTTAATQAITAAFAAATSTVTAPEPYVVDAEWPTEIDCATLDAGGLIGAAAGGAGGAGMEWGGDAEPNTGYYAAQTPAGVTKCGWAGAGDENAVVTVLPGGAWAVDEVSTAAGAAPVEVEGADSAVAVGDRLHVFAGDNWFTITVTSAGTDAFVPAAAELVAELDALS
ncbi:hypothetical protein HD599_002532 [Conyzicola lurida]|uniref:DUF3558 domain-containing protein n=1 Tax=Conyzicola lurida TaxID=1172621 RepID=A0A841AS08_9MICO|nr:hypothetical protein [Conyzicola lurida]MBB5844209.1 hypothetical protein [Conyzicola lurida]